MVEQQKALAYLRQLGRELAFLHEQSAKAINAVLAKEQFQKWKKQTLVVLGDKVGEEYAKALSKEWLEATFPGGDMYEELDFDIEMCVRHIKKLTRDIEARGLKPYGDTYSLTS